MTNGKILIKRAYDLYEETDGYRLLVDRLWPRGVTKEKLHCHRWAKEIAPSNELRKLFHGKDDFVGFRKAYFQELEQNGQASDFLAECREKLQSGNVTFIYASKNNQENNAVVLKEWVEQQ